MNSIIQLIIFLYLQLMINMFEKCSHIFDNMSDHFDQELNCSFIINYRISLDIYCSTLSWQHHRMTRSLVLHGKTDVEIESLHSILF